MKKTLSLLFLIMFMKLFSQSEWKYMGSSVQDVEFYTKTIEDNSFYTSCWVKMVAPTKSYKNRNGKSVKKSGYYIVQKWTIYCSEKTYTVSSSITYNMNGTVRYDDSVYTQPNQTPLPDTVADYIVNMKCTLNPYINK